MTNPRCDALVIFGATGDLAYKMIFPALQALTRHGRLEIPIVGVAKAGWDLEQLKARAKDSLEKNSQFDPAAFARLSARLQYIDGDYLDPETFVRLRKVLGSAAMPLYYLAIPPVMFITVAEGLAASGCAKGARVVVEKPFGHDLPSAQELNRKLHVYFPDEDIFRIDHFLGKEPVQNLIYFRFANPLIQAGWNNSAIDSVQITMAESFGVQGRGKFYDETGAIRDVVQNHLLQLIACLAMECPKEKGHESMRDERGRVLKSVRTLNPSDLVRGQFRGYRQEPGVAPDSQAETYAALRFYIDNPKWTGVPFYVRAGKCLPLTATEILVRFKKSPLAILDDSTMPQSNYYRFRLNPAVILALGANVKKPGGRMEGERIEMIARYQPPDEMEPYERLLGDAIDGDATLFAGEDSVEESWRIVDPVLKNPSSLYEYEPGAWGPREAEKLILEGNWHDPERTDASAQTNICS